jgi:hypothetical protein
MTKALAFILGIDATCEKPTVGGMNLVCLFQTHLRIGADRECVGRHATALIAMRECHAASGVMSQAKADAPEFGVLLALLGRLF